MRHVGGRAAGAAQIRQPGPGRADLQQWGSTARVIAPDDVKDIRRVAWLTGHDDLTHDRTWERIGAMAAEMRRLHQALGRASGAIAEAAGGRPSENLRKLSDLCGGMDASEVLEEFELRQIRAVGGPSRALVTQLRKVLPSPCRTT